MLKYCEVREKQTIRRKVLVNAYLGFYWYIITFVSCRDKNKIIKTELLTFYNQTGKSLGIAIINLRNVDSK